MRRFRPIPKGRQTPEYDEIAPAGERTEKEPETRPRRTPPVCWRVSRVAQHLDLSKKRVYQLVEQGQLDAVRMGPRGMRILVPSIERYVEGLRRMEGGFRG